MVSDWCIVIGRSLFILCWFSWTGHHSFARAKERSKKARRHNVNSNLNVNLNLNVNAIRYLSNVTVPFLERRFFGAVMSR
jgi:hypothetical protein